MTQSLFVPLLKRPFLYRSTTGWHTFFLINILFTVQTKQVISEPKLAHNNINCYRNITCGFGRLNLFWFVSSVCGSSVKRLLNNRRWIHLIYENMEKNQPGWLLLWNQMNECDDLSQQMLGMLLVLKRLIHGGRKTLTKVNKGKEKKKTTGKWSRRSKDGGWEQKNSQADWK